MEDFAKYLVSLGVGGIIAGLIFTAYRKDIKMYTELWKTQSELLVTIIKENTRATTENTILVRALHARLDKEDKVANK